ncbi:MAG: hypothetical protein Q9170_006982 [Blastenia crenularia]
MIAKYTVADLDSTVNYSLRPQESRSLVYAFLDQFEEIEMRRSNQYEKGTFHLIANSARYQKRLLARLRLLPKDERDQLTLITSLLRCLTMTSQISDVDSNWSSAIRFDGLETIELRTEGINDYWGLESGITVQRHPRSNPRSIAAKLKMYPQNLRATLKQAITTIQQMMFQRRPQDVPCLIYSLCLLDLTVHALRPMAEFMSPIREVGDEVRDILKILCNLYLFCFGNMHPFSEDFSITKYETIVNDDAIAIEHFRTLIELWEEAGKMVPD